MCGLLLCSLQRCPSRPPQSIPSVPNRSPTGSHSSAPAQSPSAVRPADPRRSTSRRRQRQTQPRWPVRMHQHQVAGARKSNRFDSTPAAATPLQQQPIPTPISSMAQRHTCGISIEYGGQSRECMGWGVCGWDKGNRAQERKEVLWHHIIHPVVVRSPAEEVSLVAESYPQCY